MLKNVHIPATTALDSIDEFGVIWRSSGTESGDKTKGHPYKGPFQNEGTGEGWDNIDNYELSFIIGGKKNGKCNST